MTLALILSPSKVFIKRYSSRLRIQCTWCNLTKWGMMPLVLHRRCSGVLVVEVGRRARHSRCCSCRRGHNTGLTRLRDMPPRQAMTLSFILFDGID